MIIRNKKHTVRSAFLACLLIITLNCSLFTAPAGATTNLSSLTLNWAPYYGLPHDSTNGSNISWSIEERVRSNHSTFFAHQLASGGERQFCIANSGAAPVFQVQPLGLPPYISATTTAMCTWSNSYPEFFIGSTTGIWRYDEALQSFVSIWYWNWDATYIVSVGDSLYGSVMNFGSKSGAHLWSPTNELYWPDGGRTTQIWADPISGLYGDGFRLVRVTSPTSSLMLMNRWTFGDGNYFWSAEYSRDGGLTFASPVGIRADGLPMYVSGFYQHSGDIIVVKTSNINDPYDSLLFIGELGGTMYSLQCPITNIGTFFYSPTTRFLLVGNQTGTEFYSAILPATDEVLPELAIASAVIVSWPAQYSTAVLQSATSLSGPWTEVSAPRNVVGNVVSVAIPTTGSKQYYRLFLP